MRASSMTITITIVSSILVLARPQARKGGILHVFVLTVTAAVGARTKVCGEGMFLIDIDVVISFVMRAGVVWK